MPSPFDRGYAANDPIYDALDELRDKRAEQTQRWKQFDTERDSLAKAGLLEDDQAGAGRLSELSESYEKATAEVKTLEDRVQELGRSSFRPDDPGVQEKAWARAVVSRLIERKALDATTGGTIPPPFLRPEPSPAPGGEPVRSKRHPRHRGSERRPRELPPPDGQGQRGRAGRGG